MGSERMKLKKRQKKEAIEDVAFEIFCQKGIADTTIGEIAEGAKIAKGTFYLYFNSKADLIESLILREASRVLNDAIEKMSSTAFNAPDRARKVIFIVDYIIDYFQKNPHFLVFIHKNLYRGLLSAKNRAVVEMEIRQIAKIEKLDSETFQKKLYLILELVGSVAYNAILLEKPYQIREIKPMLYEAVRRLIEI